jgi:hypothetical protein
VIFGLLGNFEKPKEMVTFGQLFAKEFFYIFHFTRQFQNRIYCKYIKVSKGFL